MNDSNSSSNPGTTRVTLKLKAGVRRAQPEPKTPAPAKQQTQSKAKPGARWSDDYVQSMQADMDLLTTR